MARPHVECLVGRSVDVDLGGMTTGYTSAPVHSVSGPSVGSVQLLADGRTARFTPPAGFSGLAFFNFNVSDSQGDSMTATIGVLVTETYNTPPQVRMTSRSGVMTLEFNGAAGATCRIQYSTDLINWTDWQTFTANGSVQAFSIPPALQTGSKRFFRAVQ
jgi:hypothetical protein